MKNGDIKTSQTYTYNIDEAIGEGVVSGGSGDGHYHANLAILNSITQSKINEWNNKANKNYVDDEISKIELKEGPQGPKGDKGDIGPQGPAGTVDVSNFYNKAEVNEKMGNKNFKYLTQVEYEALPSVEKNDSNVVYGIIDMEDIFSLNLEGNTLSLLKNGKAISSVVIQSVQDDGEVDNNPILASSISLDKATYAMKVGETFQLNYTINPSNATNKDVVWETSNDKCTVLNGLVSAISVGECVVTVKTVEGSKMASCTITISEGQNIGPSTGATLVHSYDFAVDNNDKINSFNLDSSRKATRSSEFMVERFESFSIKAVGTFTSQYLNEIFSGYPKEGKNITSLYSPAVGRFQIYRDISYGAAKGDVSIKYYNSGMQEITEKTTGQIPKGSTSTIILTYNKQDSETNIYIDGVNVYCGNIDLNIDGLIVDNSLKTLEVYDGIISMEA